MAICLGVHGELDVGVCSLHSLIIHLSDSCDRIFPYRY